MFTSNNTKELIFSFAQLILMSIQKYDTVDSRYLEFDGTMEKIRVDHGSTQEELRKYRKCSLFNDKCEFEPHSWQGVLDTTLCDKVCH